MTALNVLHVGFSWDYTSVHVLTMTWIDGVKLTNKPAMEAAGLEVTDFVDVGIEATLTQLLGDAGCAILEYAALCKGPFAVGSIWF